MRTDEFDEALHLLPAALRARAAKLRPHLMSERCPHRQEIGDALELALMAARYKEFTASGHLIGAAERLAGDHTHDPPRRPPEPGPKRGWAGPTARPGETYPAAGRDLPCGRA